MDRNDKIIFVIFIIILIYSIIQVIQIPRANLVVIPTGNTLALSNTIVMSLNQQSSFLNGTITISNISTFYFPHGAVTPNNQNTIVYTAKTEFDISSTYNSPIFLSRSYFKSIDKDPANVAIYQQVNETIIANVPFTYSYQALKTFTCPIGSTLIYNGINDAHPIFKCIRNGGTTYSSNYISSNPVLIFPLSGSNTISNTQVAYTFTFNGVNTVIVGNVPTIKEITVWQNLTSNQLVINKGINHLKVQADIHGIGNVYTYNIIFSSNDAVNPAFTLNSYSIDYSSFNAMMLQQNGLPNSISGNNFIRIGNGIIDSANINTYNVLKITNKPITTIDIDPTWVNPSGVVKLVNISLNNKQSSGAITPNIPIYISVNTLNYSAYINGGANNIELYNGLQGNVLYQFIVGNTANELQTTSLNTVLSLGIYFTLPASIAASTNAVNVITLGFLGMSTVALNGNNVGEAPQLSSTYNAYPQANVFTSFVQWGGLSVVPTGWTGNGGASSATFNTKNTVIKDTDANYDGVNTLQVAGTNTFNTIESLVTLTNYYANFGLGITMDTNPATTLGQGAEILADPTFGECPSPSTNFCFATNLASTTTATTQVIPTANTPLDMAIVFGNLGQVNALLVGNTLGYNTMLGQVAHVGNEKDFEYWTYTLGNVSIYWTMVRRNPPNNAMPTDIFGIVQSPASAGGNTATLIANPNPFQESNTVIDVGQYATLNTIISNGVAPYTGNWAWTAPNTLLSANPVNTINDNVLVGTTVNAVLIFNGYATTNEVFTYNGKTYLTNALGTNQLVGVWTFTFGGFDAGINTIKTSTNIVTLNPAFGLPTLTISNSPNIDNGQYEVLTATASGGSNPYTYNFNIYNTITGTIIANALYTGCTLTTNTFVYQFSSTWAANTFKANVTISDAATTKQTKNSIKTAMITENQKSTTSPATFIVPDGITKYDNISIINNQSTFDQAGFQQKLLIDSGALYETYANNAFTNWVIFNGITGNIMYSWMEGNQGNYLQTAGLNTINSLVIWTVLPFKLLNYTHAYNALSIGFYPMSTNSMNGNNVGEAPQITCSNSATNGCTTYGKWDNGGKVFNSYDNFAGSSLSSNWTQTALSILTITVNNGIVFAGSPTLGGSGGIRTTPTYYQGNVFEVMPTNFISQSSANTYIEESTSSTFITTGAFENGYSYTRLSATNFGIDKLSALGIPTSVTGGGVNNILPAIAGITWLNPFASLITPVNEIANDTATNTNSVTGADTSIATGINYYSISTSGSTNLDSISVQFARGRFYPANGMMPNVVISAITNPPTLTTPTLTLSNTLIDQGQSILFTANVIDGTPPYTYNFNIVNSITNVIIGNMLIASNSYAQNAFFWTPNPNLYVSNTVRANVIIKDSAGSPVTTNSIYTSIGYNSAAITTISTSNSLLDSGQTETLTATATGGTSPFTINFYNVTGSSTGLFIGYQQWMLSTTANYPNVLAPTSTNNGINGQSCLTYTSNVYCIAGESEYGALDTNQVYYSPILSSGGLGSWTTTNAYPTNSAQSGCTMFSNTIYCIGGLNIVGNINQNAVYYAPIFNSGALGSWTSTNAYPLNTSSTSCIAYVANVYCIGGQKQPVVAFNAVYYAPILANNALGSWTATNALPQNTDTMSCDLNGNIIYCIGGEINLAQGLTTNQIYYASIFKSGVLSTWTITNAYPYNVITQQCNVVTNNIYCVGGDINGEVLHSSEAFFSPILSTGVIGSWTATTNYPQNLIWSSCVTNNANNFANTMMYCIGGDLGVHLVNTIFYAPVNALGIANSLTYSFVTSSPNSPAGGNVFKFNTILTDTGTTTPFVNNSVTTSFTVNAVLGTPTLAVSNTILDSGQYVILTATETGGTQAYTYNFLIFNSVDNSIIANQLGTSSTFSIQTNSLWVTNSQVKANVIVTDSATTSVTKNSINTVGITINTAPTLAISPSNILLDSGQTVTWTLTDTGGTSPFTFNFINVTGGTRQPIGGVNTLILSAGGSNTVSFVVTSVNNNNAFQFTANAVDYGTTANYVFNSPYSTITINAVMNTPSITTPSPTTQSTGNVLTWTTTFTGGTSSFTYNWNVYNTITGAIVSNLLETNSFRSNSFSYTAVLGNSINANVAITDSATTSVTKNSVKSGTITIVQTSCSFTTSNSGAINFGSVGVGTHTAGTVNVVTITNTGSSGSNVFVSASNWIYLANSFYYTNTIWTGVASNSLWSTANFVPYNQLANVPIVMNQITNGGQDTLIFVPSSSATNNIWYGVNVPLGIAGSGSGNYFQAANLISLC